MAMDPPDQHEEATQAAAAAWSDPGPGPSIKRARETPICEADFITIGREFQNRSKHKVGSDLSEDQKFRSFFGIAPSIALKAWNMMHSYDLQPLGATIEHYLWGLFFMKVYPQNEQVTAAVAGGEVGARDPKTLRKYIWPMIRALANLEVYVVSTTLLIVSCSYQHISN